MAENDNDKFGLIDFIIFHQLVVERFKLWLRNKFLPVQQDIAAGVRQELVRLSVDKMSDLTKKDLRELYTRINKFQNTPYHYWTRFLDAEMKKFSNADQRIIHKAYKKILGDSGYPAPTRGTAFDKFSTKPLSAGGKYPEDFLGEFIEKSKLGIADRIQQGYASGETPAETTRAIIGTRQAKFKDGLLHKQHNGSNTVVNTLMQHLTGTTSQMIEKNYTDCYQWLSVMDSRTSDICIELNLDVFRQGEGPIPPAHPNCRSRTMVCQCDGQPLMNRAGVPQSNQRGMVDWIEGQDKITLDEVFGKVRIEMIENDQISFHDLANTNLKPWDVLRSAEGLNDYLNRRYGP